MGTINRRLPVPLSPAEIRQKADQLAEKVQEQADVKTIAKGAAAEYKERLEQLAGEASVLARQIRSRSEERPVTCSESPDYSRGMMDLAREDTGEVVESRPLTFEERQGELPRLHEENRAG